MKQLTMKSKIIGAIIALIIIIGAIVASVKGFNFELKNQNAKMVEIYIGKQFLLPNIKEIVTEVLETNEYVVQKVEVFDEGLAITAKDISEEQRDNLVKKINEMYGVELNAENIEIKTIPHIHLKDIVKPYIAPFAISTVIILIYIGIRYIKLGSVKSVLLAGGILVISEATLFSTMAIFRIPIGRFTLPLTLFVYLITLLGITIKFEKELKDIITEENK